MQDFRRISEHNLVQPLTTEILRHEIVSDMTEKVEEAQLALRTIGKKSDILRQIFPDVTDPLASLGDADRRPEMASRLEIMANSYLRDIRAIDVPLPDGGMRRILPRLRDPSGPLS